MERRRLLKGIFASGIVGFGVSTPWQSPLLGIETGFAASLPDEDDIVAEIAADKTASPRGNRVVSREMLEKFKDVGASAKTDRLKPAPKAEEKAPAKVVKEPAPEKPAAQQPVHDPLRLWPGKQKDDAHVAVIPVPTPRPDDLSIPFLAQNSASRLLFYSVNTSEKMAFDLREIAHGDLDHKAINHFMRDWRIDEERNIESRLLLRFARVAGVLHDGGADISNAELISGYRSPKTNGRKKGQAKNSQHMYGCAMDWRVPGVSLKNLYRAAWRVAQEEGVGGVGYYPASTSNFVHTDIAGLRHWPKPLVAQL